MISYSAKHCTLGVSIGILLVLSADAAYNLSQKGEVGACNEVIFKLCAFKLPHNNKGNNKILVIILKKESLCLSFAINLWKLSLTLYIFLLEIDFTIEYVCSRWVIKINHWSFLNSLILLSRDKTNSSIAKMFSFRSSKNCCADCIDTDTRCKHHKSDAI